MKLNEFNNAFQTEQDCLKYIASLKKNKCIMCSWTSLCKVVQTFWTIFHLIKVYQNNP
ncbi:hypothetical protein [Spiroplasma ixodetis]|uniref:hypothetical protein n=1 Tax=Spiroplasma ixodetis TaxID=2141 RepID=UPI002576E213|nr:hypothetical protein [Spiroplasma ixodetis]